MPMLGGLLAALLVLPAAWCDWRSGRIPNLLTYAGLLLAAANAALGDTAVNAAIIGFAAGFLPAFLLFACGSLGGGDVKLLGAVGGLVGWPAMLDVWIYTLCIGAVLAFCQILWCGRMAEFLRGTGRLLWAMAWPGLRRDVPLSDLRIPFGLAIAGGTVGAWLRMVLP